MLQALPQRQAKKSQLANASYAHAHPAKAAIPTGADDSPHAFTTSLPSEAATRASGQALDRPETVLGGLEGVQAAAMDLDRAQSLAGVADTTQIAAQGGVSLMKHFASSSSSKPQGHSAFRLSFSPTGIPSVDSSHQVPQALGKHIDSPLVSATHSLHSPAPTTQAVPSSQMPSIPAVSATQPVAAHIFLAQDSRPPASSFGLHSDTISGSAEASSENGLAPAAQGSRQVPKTPMDEVDHPAHQAADHTAGAEASDWSMPQPMGSQPTPKLRQDTQADASATVATNSGSALMPLATSDAVVYPPSLEAHAQAGLTSIGDSASQLQPCSPSGSSAVLLPPSTPMLAWLAALATPKSESEVLTKQTLGNGRAPLALANESTPSLLAACPTASSVAASCIVPLLPASEPSGDAAVPPARTDADASSQNHTPVELTTPSPCSTQTAPASVSDQTAFASLPEQATPAALPNQASPVQALTDVQSPQATPASVPKQASALVPNQASPVWALTGSQTLQATPAVQPKHATPHMGPPTGLSGLTTPASAAEMHRWVS